MKIKTKILVSSLSVLGLVGVGATVYGVVSKVNSNSDINSLKSNDLQVRTIWTSELKSSIDSKFEEKGEQAFEESINNEIDLREIVGQVPSGGIEAEVEQSNNDVVDVTLTLKNNNQEDGTVTFENSQSTITKKSGQTVNLEVTNVKKGKTITKVEVFIKDKSITLGVDEKEGKYSFTLPPAKIKDEKTGLMVVHPFYKDGYDIKVETSFGDKFIGDWEFKFESGTSSGYYTYTVNEEGFVWDETARPSLKMIEGKQQSIIQCHIDLNGHDLKIKEMTVPKWVQIMFVNSKKEKLGDKTVSLEGNLNFQGVMGRYHGVKYDEKMDIKLNIRGYAH